PNQPAGLACKLSSLLTALGALDTADPAPPATPMRYGPSGLRSDAPQPGNRRLRTGESAATGQSDSPPQSTTGHDDGSGPASTRRRSARSPDFAPGCTAAPPARDTRNRTTDHQVGNERQKQGDDECLDRIERAQHNELVDHVHHQPEKDDPGGRVQPLTQTCDTLLRLEHDRPQM